ncbi:hypothetical protein VNI00_009427 [Paramarasmius palmivorus]|uniref:F-box domain-containing protein n=1 Tax=Paramarasmius palmivorus TaxID=297713 RepID=A0AAW0CLM2_9AGAR
MLVRTDCFSQYMKTVLLKPTRSQYLRTITTPDRDLLNSVYPYRLALFMKTVLLKPTRSQYLRTIITPDRDLLNSVYPYRLALFMKTVLLKPTRGQYLRTITTPDRDLLNSVHQYRSALTVSLTLAQGWFHQTIIMLVVPNCHKSVCLYDLSQTVLLKPTRTRYLRTNPMPDQDLSKSVYPYRAALVGSGILIYDSAELALYRPFRYQVGFTKLSLRPAAPKSSLFEVGLPVRFSLGRETTVPQGGCRSRKTFGLSPFTSEQGTVGVLFVFSRHPLTFDSHLPMGSTLSLVVAQLSQDIDNLPPCPRATDEREVNKKMASLLFLELQPLRHRLNQFRNTFPEDEFKRLRRKLRGHYQAGRRLASPIHGCPLEVLSAILSHVIQPVEVTELTLSTWGGNSDALAQFTPLYPWAYVSSKFRRALLTTPRHFDHIVVHRHARCVGEGAHRPMLMEKLNFFLSLSGVLPLHVKVVLSLQWGDQNDTAALPTCPIINRLLERPWKSFSIQGSARNSSILLLRHTIALITPNVLTTLELHIAEGPTLDSYRELSRLPSTITTLRLSFGCGYPDTPVSFAILLPHITDLRVRGCLRSIFTVLIGCPEVRRLEAVMVGNIIPEWYLTFTMPSIEYIEASVDAYPGEEFLPFFRYLRAPSTQSLVVHWNVSSPKITSGLFPAMDKFIWSLDDFRDLTLLGTPFSFQEARAMMGSASRLFYTSSDPYRWRLSWEVENWTWRRDSQEDSDSLASSVDEEWGGATPPWGWRMNNEWGDAWDDGSSGGYGDATAD